MAQLDFAERQLTLKLVYYGPPHSGKTSNLRALHSAVDKLNRGRLMTLDTRDDRTLFFDLLPVFFRASGFSFQLKVYTVPGQPVHEATRKIVLANADAVAFIADSQPDHREANRLSWQNLLTNLKAKNLEGVPVVVQYNKRDLPEAVPISEVDRFGDPGRVVHEACARTGGGVVETFFDLVGRAWDHLDTDRRLSDRFGIDSATFQSALAEHVGVVEPGKITE
ncbi:MAG TPA: GTPase domain-containing protein [Kofleriaceae bacterium]|nr:GTPase domain-containing protein [Kofleriaceae bacterium]